MWHYKTLRRTTLLTIFCCALLMGLVLARYISGVGWGWLLLAGVAFLIGLWRPKVWSFSMMVTAGMLVGLWRGGVVDSQLGIYDSYVDTKQVVQGVITEDPLREASSRQSLMLGSVVIGGIKQPGAIKVETLDDQKFQRGDTVVVEGKMRQGFASYQASMSFATLLRSTKSDNLVLTLRQNFSDSVRAAMNEPQASLGLGFVIGEHSQLPMQLSEDMKRVSLTHIVVASGYNLTILVRLSRRLFSKHSKYMAAILSLGLVGGFLLVTGFSPSMSRAGLVTLLSIWAWYYGRSIHPLTLLSVAAALTAVVNPIYIWSDVGWYLSFLSFAGVLLLAPLVQRWLFARRSVGVISQVSIETICAQLATLPVSLLIFGKLSVLGVIANILVCPLLPLAMLVVFAAGMVELVVPFVGSLIGMIGDWLIGYMAAVIQWVAAAPWAQVSVQASSWSVALLVIAMVLSGVVLHRRLKYDYSASSIID